MPQPTFSHVAYASDYMRIAVDLVKQRFGDDLTGKTVLDVPAGNGWVGEQLSLVGGDVTSADINEEKPEFAQVDMERPLPFAPESFDVVICCEGIEHVFSPFHLFSELARVLRPNGLLIITTPNVQNLYSRWQFLCTGYLFQFDPFNKVPLAPNQLGDKGHISPVSYPQLRYYAEHLGLEISRPTGGRMKRKILLIILAPLLLIGLWWNWRDWKRTSGNIGRRNIIRHLFTWRVLLSRSLIFSAVKPINLQ